MTKTEWVAKFALALVDKHGRPVKLAYAIAISEYLQRSSADPEEAAGAWCAERGGKTAAPAKPKRR